MKKIRVYAVALAALLLTACGAQTESAPAEPTPEPFDLAAYKEDVGACRTAIMDNAVMVYNMAKYEVTWLQAHESVGGSEPDAADLAAKAYEWLAENSDATQESVEQADADIRSAYKDISITAVEGEEAEKIEAAIAALFDSYDDLYAAATQPAVTSDDVTAVAGAAIDALQDADRDLGLYLD